MKLRTWFGLVVGIIVPIVALGRDLSYYEEALKDNELLEFLKYKTYVRPSKCPMKSNSSRDLLDKMILVRNGLANGPCKEKQQQLISGLTDISNAVAKSRKAFSSAPGGAPAQPQASVPSTSQSVLNGLSELPKDAVCLQDLQNKGLVSTLADLATSIGQVSMVAPTPAGVLIGTVAITFGTTLKVIAGLLTSPFDFSIEKDRRQFVDLNCSFFDLRRQLDVVGIFEAKGGDREPTKQKGQVLSSGLKTKLSEMQAEVPDGDAKDRVEDAYEGMILDLDSKIALLSLLQYKEAFDPSGESVHLAFDIMKEYQAIQKIIFGKRGWAFTRYLLKQMYKDYRHFSWRFDQWQDEWLKNQAEPEPIRTKWLCRNATQIRSDWEAANYSLEHAVEFLDSNKGIFHTYVPRFKYFIKIIPTGSSNQYHLYKNLKAIEMAKEAMAGGAKVNMDQRWKIRKNHLTWGHNVGVLAVKIKSRKGDRTIIEDFINDNNCLDLN